MVEDALDLSNADRGTLDGGMESRSAKQSMDWIFGMEKRSERIMK